MSIDICPPELIESIVKLLSNKDVLNLRLCNKALAILAAGDTFKSWYRTRTVYLSLAGLNDFLRFTESRFPASLLKEIVIVGEAVDITKEHSIVQYPDMLIKGDLALYQKILDILQARIAEQEASDQTGAAVELLSKALSKLSEHGNAYSLSLDLAILRSTDGERPTEIRRHAFGPDWRFYRFHRPIIRTAEQFDFTVDTRAAASRTLRICLASVAQSRLRIESLDVFHLQLHCTPSCRELRDIALHEEGLRAAFKPLRCLSISLCARVLSEDEKDEDADTQKALLQAKDNFTGFRTFLSFMPALETLDAHWYTLSPDDGLRFFRELSVSVLTMPFLRECSLDGVTVTEQSLLRFLQSVPLKRLSIIEVELLAFTGSFSPIFSHITQRSSIENLLLSELHNENHMLFFEPPVVCITTNIGPPLGSNTLIRRGAKHVRLPINYTTPPWGKDKEKEKKLSGRGPQTMRKYGRTFGPRARRVADRGFDD